MHRTICLVVMLWLPLFAQGQATIMTYNILNYNTATDRNEYFRTVIHTVSPDVVVVQEILSSTGVTNFLNNVLNYSGSEYSAGTFINGPDTDNAIFYKHALFSFISNTPISTALRDINEFKIVYAASGDTLRIYSVHLKSSQGTANQQERLAEVNALRQVTNGLPANRDFLILGDFNIYTTSEPAYQALTSQTSPGYVLDPLNSPGSWHDNAAFAAIHTQSSRTTAFGGGATGGMDDRFDMALISQAVNDPGGVSYINNSCTAYGNDGAHLNAAINVQPNNAVPANIANALHNASDHLPVLLTLQFEAVGILADLKVFLEGPFQSGAMHTALNAQNALPTTQPYNGAPWNYNGTESVSAFPAGVVDWLLLELRSGTGAATTVAARAAFLKSDGRVVDLDGSSALRFPAVPGNYYVVVHHRNHLAIMSATALPLSSGAILYDFTTASSKAFGTAPMKQLPGGAYGMYSGDGDASGIVGTPDRDFVWRSQNGVSWNYSNFGDFNLDGGVDALDLNLFWRPNNGRASQVPLIP